MPKFIAVFGRSCFDSETIHTVRVDIDGQVAFVSEITEGWGDAYLKTALEGLVGMGIVDVVLGDEDIVDWARRNDVVISVDLVDVGAGGQLHMC